jgi:hypothetical protein
MIQLLHGNYVSQQLLFVYEEDEAETLGRPCGVGNGVKFQEQTRVDWLAG